MMALLITTLMPLFLMPQASASWSPLVQSVDLAISAMDSVLPSFGGGFSGGFTDGTYGYIVPYKDATMPYSNATTFHSKVVRFSLLTFGDVKVLDVATKDAGLKGFRGGFTDGTYGYLVPYKNEAGYHGKVVRFSLQTFGDVQVLDVATTDADFKGFRGGFTDGTYGYMVPHKRRSSCHGKIARFSLQTFSDIQVLDMAAADADLKGFRGGFTDGTYGYLVPFKNGRYRSGAGHHGKIARFNLRTFGDVQVLDVAATGAGLTGFRDGFSDGTYGYLVPFKNGAGYHGNVVRFSLQTFGDVRVLDVSTTDANLKGFVGSFTDGTYGYLMAYKNGAGYLGKVARFSLRTFGDVQVLNVDETDAGLRGFRGGFTDGTYAYLVPYKNSKLARFRVAKTTLTSSTGTTSMIRP